MRLVFGVDGKPNSKVSTSFTTESGVANTPTVEGQLWNNITQQNAANACRNMYDSSYGATSDLVNSYAWDTAIVFIQKYSGDSRYSNQNSLNTSLANTGANGDEKCHIQDMASNCAEWSTETNGDENFSCILRGGSCLQSSWDASTRDQYSVSHSYAFGSFRPVLYL